LHKYEELLFNNTIKFYLVPENIIIKYDDNVGLPTNYIKPNINNNKKEEIVVEETKENIENDMYQQKILIPNNIDICSICLDPIFTNGSNTLYLHTCNNLFHLNCILRWCKKIDENSCECPNCRGEIS
jgi:hypothetical protein